ncbi:uncharacterized protein [Branchiostoma lanceolatum]|uniref:uncharacterized protein n=1 Tax=Branchiostoma lanceolatum TaxID=7740 RepID=UPI0034565E48
MTSGLPAVGHVRTPHASPLPKVRRNGRKRTTDGGNEEFPGPGKDRLTPRDLSETPVLHHRRTKSMGKRKTRAGEILVHKSWPLGGASLRPSLVDLNAISQSGVGAKPLPPIQRKASSGLGPITEYEVEKGVKPTFGDLPSLQLYPNGKKHSFYGAGVGGHAQQTDKSRPKDSHQENRSYAKQPYADMRHQSSHTLNRTVHDKTNDIEQSSGTVDRPGDDFLKGTSQNNRRNTASRERHIQTRPTEATQEDIISIDNDNGVTGRNNTRPTTASTGASWKGLLSGIVGRMRLMARRDKPSAEVESAVSRTIEQHREEANRLTHARSTARLRQDASLQEKLIERRLRRKAMLEETSQQQNQSAES